MTLVLLIAGTEAERENVERYVRAGHVDGVLLFSSHESDALLASLVAAGVPTVCSGVPTGDLAIDDAGEEGRHGAEPRDGGHHGRACASGLR